MAGSKDEIRDIRDEFISHLLASKADFKKDGYSDEEAEKKAISHFGIPEKIADEMHEAMFPHRKLLCLILAVSSLFTAFSVYFAALFLNNDAYYGTLITAVTTGIVFLLFASGRFPRWEKIRYFITTLIVHILTFINFAMILADIRSAIQLPLNILVYTIILFAVILIYFIVLSANSMEHRSLLIIHGANITLGFIYIAFSLFMLWASLLFGGEITIISLIALIPTVIWIIAYIVQIKAIKNKKNTIAFSVLAILAFISFTFFWILYG